MTISVASLQVLMSLHLTTEQMAGVLGVLAVELAPLERMMADEKARKEAAATRQQRHKQRHAGVSTTSAQRQCDVSLTSRAGVTSNNLLPYQEDSLRKAPPIIPPNGFDAFWSLYPRRDGSQPRKPAEKAFAAALKRGAKIEAILDGARHFSEAMAERGQIGTQFIPMARTWLNQERWNERYGQASQHHKQPTIRDSFAILDAVADEAIRQSGGFGQEGGEENPFGLPGLRKSAA